MREWKYFSDLELFTRKLDVYITIPCVRPPHVDLCHLLVENIFPFQRFFGFGGGLWRWQVLGSAVPGARSSDPVEGNFLMLPEEVGLYDTKDLTTSPTEILEWFTRQIDTLQRETYRRDGVSAMATSQSDGDASSQSTVAARIISSTLPIQAERAKRR